MMDPIIPQEILLARDILGVALASLSRCSDEEKTQVVQDIIGFLSKFPSFIKEFFQVQLDDVRRDNNGRDDDEDESSDQEDNSELKGQIDAGTPLCFFLYYGVQLDAIQALLEILPQHERCHFLCERNLVTGMQEASFSERHGHLLRIGDDHLAGIKPEETSAVHLAFAYSSRDVIEYFATSFSGLLGYTCFELAEQRSRDEIPYSTLKLLLEAHPVPVAKMLVVLQRALEEAWPHDLIALMVHQYRRSGFSGFFSRESVRLSQSTAEILSPLFNKVNDAELPRVADFDALRCILERLAQSECKVRKLFLRLPSLLNLDDNEREDNMWFFKDGLQRLSSLTEVILECQDDTESEETQTLWIQAIQEGIANNKLLRLVDFRSDDIHLLIRLHPLLIADTDSLKPHEQQQVQELVAAEPGGRLTREESIHIWEEYEKPLPPLGLITTIVALCHHPTLVINCENFDRHPEDISDTVELLLHQNPRLCGLCLREGFKVDLPRIFRLLVSNNVMKYFQVVASDRHPTYTEDKELANQAFLELIENNNTSLQVNFWEKPMGDLTDNYNIPCKADSKTYYYLLLNRMGRGSVRDATLGQLVCLLSACQENSNLHQYYVDEIDVLGLDFLKVDFGHYEMAIEAISTEEGVEVAGTGQEAAAEMEEDEEGEEVEDMVVEEVEEPREDEWSGVNDTVDDDDDEEEVDDEEEEVDDEEHRERMRVSIIWGLLHEDPALWAGEDNDMID